MKIADIEYPQVVLAVVAIITVIGLLYAASTSTAAFGVYNPTWDGASDLQSVADDAGIDSEVIRNASRYASVPANGTVAVILSPERPYEPAEVERVRTFVRDGGTLLIAEDFGAYSNPLLSELNTSIRFDGQLLRDERYNYQSPAMPVARNVSNHTLTEGVNSLTLNYGTAVQPNNSTVLVETSAFAYRDVNRNKELDDQESLDSYPVATTESVGDGQVIAVGDPSLLINTMLDRSGNRAFIENVFEQHDRVLLDYSHAGQLPPLSVALLVVRDTPLLQFLLGVIAIAGIGYWFRQPRLLTRLRSVLGDSEPTIEADPDELAALVRQQHPDWDEDRIQRVTQAVMKHRREPRADE